MSLIEEAIKRRRASSATEASRTTVKTSVVKEGARYVRRTLGDASRTKRLDRDALRRVGLLPPESEARHIEHQFRTLKRPLISSAFPADSPEQAGADRRLQRALMISSALPGDGKTFTSLNLALSMAMERDHTVVLVDGDVAKPHLSGLFGAQSEPGLLDALENPELSISSVVLPTDVAGLSIVPVGRQSEQATELLASERMLTLLAELQAMDPRLIVLVDSPPILLTSEARVLGSLFGQVLLVVRAGGTPQQAVKDAVAVLGEGPRISVVLNQALHAGEGGYYGYGTNYGYGGTSSAMVEPS